MKPAFFVIQCFDRDGYFTSVRADSLDAVREEASKRMNRNFIAMSLPFEGAWSKGELPDLTLPPDFKEGLSSINKTARDE